VGDQFAQRNFAGGKADKLRQEVEMGKSRSSSLRLTESAMTSPVNALVIDPISIVVVAAPSSSNGISPRVGARKMSVRSRRWSITTCTFSV
jgi:hypothetical protein